MKPSTKGNASYFESDPDRCLDWWTQRAAIFSTDHYPLGGGWSDAIEQLVVMAELLEEGHS